MANTKYLTPEISRRLDQFILSMIQPHSSAALSKMGTSYTAPTTIVTKGQWTQGDVPDLYCTVGPQSTFVYEDGKVDFAFTGHQRHLLYERFGRKAAVYRRTERGWKRD